MNRIEIGKSNMYNIKRGVCGRTISAILAATLLLSGCGKAAGTSGDLATQNVEQGSQTTATEGVQTTAKEGSQATNMEGDNITVMQDSVAGQEVPENAGNGQEMPGNTDNAQEASGEAGTEQNTAAGEGKISEAPDWTADAVLYEVNVRQYTPSGTFDEFSEHLQEIKDMGINTLWFMPIHPISQTKRSGRLGSYYSVSDYRDVNPEFGDKEDFKELVDKAHEMGFKVMMDWVANHTGWDNAWITEHPEWYTQKDGQIISPEGMGWPDVADLNYDNKEMRLEMIDCMKYWIEEYDIDGFRCDYAPGVPADFWEEARTALDEVKDVYMIEEDLGGMAGSNLLYAFDTNYNAKLYEALVEVARDQKKADKVKLYLPGNDNNTFGMNYLDNHDVNSYDRTITQAFDEKVLPAMMSVIFTLPGVPMIYSGDEIGYDHAIAFMEKDTIDWAAGTGDYRGLIKDLSDLKKEHPALFAGNRDEEFEVIKTDNKNILAFKRTNGDDSIICIYNLYKNEISDVDLSSIIDGTETVLYSGAEGEYHEGGDNPAGETVLAPWSFYILTK